MTIVLYIALALYAAFTIFLMVDMFLGLSGCGWWTRISDPIVAGLIWPILVSVAVWDRFRWQRRPRKQDLEATAAGIHPSIAQSPLFDPGTGKLNLKWDPLYCPIDGPSGRLPRIGDALERVINYEEMWMPMYEDAEKAGQCGEGGPCRCLASSRKRVVDLRARIENGETLLTQW